ncbi:MAG: hypothetical protein ACTSUE_22415 [Promethearchaeota archaeon]
MNLTFDQIREELDLIDATREKVMVLSRKGIRACSEGIKKLHRKEAGVEESIDTVKGMLEKIMGILEESKVSLLKGHASTIFQEYVELVVLHGIFSEADVPSMMDITPKPPAVQYLLGLCDVVGELRRASIDCIRDEAFDRAFTYFDAMVTIQEEIFSLDYPNAIIPNVRHKSDVNRKLINITRSDLTMAHHMYKLNKNLSELKNSED